MVESNVISGHWVTNSCRSPALRKSVSALAFASLSTIWQISPAALNPVFPPVLIPQLRFILLSDLRWLGVYAGVWAREDHGENEKNTCYYNAGEDGKLHFTCCFFCGSQRRL